MRTHRNHGRNANHEAQPPLQPHPEERIISPRGDYRTLHSFHKAEVIYDITFRFAPGNPGTATPNRLRCYAHQNPTPMKPTSPAKSVFVGIKGSVVALEAATGTQLWATHLMGSDFVNVVLDGDRLYATTSGEIFCLDAASGEGLWHNKLKGFGRGLAAVVLSGGSAPPVTAGLLAEQQRRLVAAQAASVAGSTAAV